MEYGIFSSIYGNYKIEKAAKKIKAAGFTCVQFDPMLTEGKSLDPQKVSEKKLKRYRNAFEQEGIRIISIGAYGRLISPDPAEAKSTVEMVKAWIRLAPVLGAETVVTETGSKHPTHNWTDCPENHSKEIWAEIVSTFKELTDYAGTYGVNLAVEPHFAQPLRDAEQLRKLLDDVNSDHLKIVFDAANFVTSENAARLDQEIEKFGALLGKDIVLAHAKDANIEDRETLFSAAGKGILPYRTYLRTLKKTGYSGPVLLEWTDEEDAPRALSYMKEQEIPPFMLPLFRADAELFGNANEALNIVHKDSGALELKYRLLLSMVADALMRHPQGAAACAREAIEAGASKEEVTEAARVIYTAGGLPALIENFDIYREVLLK